MDEKLLDSLAHEAYEIEEDEEIQNGWQQYFKEQKKKSEKQQMIAEIIAEGKEIQWKEESMTQYAKDSGFVDEMVQLEQMEKEWKMQISKLAKEMENGGLIEQQSLKSCQKEQMEEDVFNAYSMDQLHLQVSIDDVIKSIDQHNHVLPMDDVKEEIDNSVQDQQFTEITQDKIMDKYIQDQVQIDKDLGKWWDNQLGKQNTNPFFGTYPCSKSGDK